MALSGNLMRKKTLSGTILRASGGGSSITVDSALSATSENPVQNKVIKAALDAIPVTRGTGNNSLIGINEDGANTAAGQDATAFGKSNEASGKNSFAAGYYNKASGISSVAIGGQVSGKGRNQATQDGATAIGQSNDASGVYSTAIGRENESSGVGSVALGYGNTASGNASFAVGGQTEAAARCSSAFGLGTEATGSHSLVAGRYNEADAATADATTGERQYAVIIGNGTDDNNRSNAATLDFSGNAVLAGKLTLGAAPSANMDAATKQYVDNAIPSVPSASSSTPAMDGTAAVGSSTAYARADHVHPTDTSRAAVADLAAKADKVTEATVSTTGAVTQALDAGKIYHFTGELTALTVTLNAPASGDPAQYHFDFLSGSTAPTLTLPGTVTMPDSFAVEAGKRYEVDILNNYGAVMAWANS